MVRALVWFSLFARAVIASPLDDLVHSMQSSDEQERKERSKRRTGDLPDLEDMRLDLHHDQYGRLSGLSADELVQVLKVLGYNDTAVLDNGNGAEVLLDDPVVSTVIHGHKIKGKSSAIARVKHTCFSVGTCVDGDNNVPTAEKLDFINSWNSDTLYSVAWWHEHHGVCIELATHLTKYDKANLHLIQRAMRHFQEQKQVFDLKFGLVLERFASRRLAGPSLDELVQHLAMQQQEQRQEKGEEQRERGPMPDLAALLAEVQSDEYERLTDPSQSDLLSMLLALGYKGADGPKDSVILFLDDPLTTSTFHHVDLKNKAPVAVSANKGNSITVFTCYKSDLPKEQKLLFLNHWGGTKSLAEPFMEDEGGLCLEADVILTKYSMANLQLLQRRMSAMAIMIEGFHVEVALKEKEAARQQRPAWQFWR